MHIRTGPLLAAPAGSAAALFGASGVAAAATSVTSGHVDIVEIECTVDEENGPLFEIGSHLAGIRARTCRRTFDFHRAAGQVVFNGALARAAALGDSPRPRAAALDDSRSRAAAPDDPLEIASGAYWLIPEVVDGGIDFRPQLGASGDPDDNPAGAVYRIPSKTEEQVDADAQFAWLGEDRSLGWESARGTLPAQIADVPALKLSTRQLTAGKLAEGAPLTPALANVVGPGDVLFSGKNSDAVPDPAPRIGTGRQRNGTPCGSSDQLSANTSYARTIERFTAKGMYCFTFVLTATLAGADAPTTAAYDAKVAVGDSTPLSAACGTPAPPEDEPDEPPTPLVLSSQHIDAIHPQLGTAADGTQTLALRSEFQSSGISFPVDHGYAGVAVADMDDIVIAGSDAIRRTLPESYTDAADYSFAGPPGTLRVSVRAGSARTARTVKVSLRGRAR